MPEHHFLLPTGTASFLVFGFLEDGIFFYDEFQLKTVTKKIQWMAGTWQPRMPKDSVQKRLKD